MGVLKDLLKPLAEEGTALTREQAAAVLEEILTGEVPEVETAALLAVLATRGEQAPELAGFVDVYPGKRAAKKLALTRAEILRVMGDDIPDREIEQSLGALGFSPVRVDQNRGVEGSLLAA